MLRNIHIIVAGNESIEKHIGALNTFKPYKVVLFNVAGDVENEKMDELMQRFNSMNIEVRKKNLPAQYGESFLAALSEIAGFRGEFKDINFAVNISTGRKIAVAAIEDAVRSPLGGDVICEEHGDPEQMRHAIRYEIVEKDGAFTVKIAPLQGTPGISMDKAYEVMPFQKARLEKIDYYRRIIPLQLRFLKNKWKRRLSLRK